MVRVDGYTSVWMATGYTETYSSRQESRLPSLLTLFFSDRWSTKLKSETLGVMGFFFLAETITDDT